MAYKAMTLQNMAKVRYEVVQEMKQFTLQQRTEAIAEAKKHGYDWRHLESYLTKKRLGFVK